MLKTDPLQKFCSPECVETLVAHPHRSLPLSLSLYLTVHASVSETGWKLFILNMCACVSACMSVSIYFQCLFKGLGNTYTYIQLLLICALWTRHFNRCRQSDNKRTKSDQLNYCLYGKFIWSDDCVFSRVLSFGAVIKNNNKQKQRKSVRRRKKKVHRQTKFNDDGFYVQHIHSNVTAHHKS